ncbi:MAG: preprotein translocase subunit SecG [Bdellovibrionaceae bacterium]|nr:preprotein translocase subunit SecG [Pseudobdellovibrionaceae bacterium]|tara:strand:+ start:13907 stop:14272 length:366 start_codon:yes stop_codon:yes gene_type:complete
MAITFLSILHIVFVVALIGLVLLQDSKGGAMGMFGGGGGSSNVFGGSGGGNFLITATKWVAICFACSCLALVWITSKKSDSVMDNYIPTQTTESAPAENPANLGTSEAPQEGATEPTPAGN